MLLDQLLLFLSTLCATNSFNLDTVGPIFKKGRSGTLFGFSVAQHLKGTQPVFLIGAPHDESGQKGTNRSGALYSCPMNSYDVYGSGAEWCDKPLVEYRHGIDNEDPRTKFIDEIDQYRQRNDKDFELLGASVSSSGKNSNIVVCAPLSRITTGDPQKKTPQTKRQFIGECYVLNNTVQRPAHSRIGPPNGDIQACAVLGSDNNLENYGQCLQGTSAVYKKELDILAVGGIGPKTHRGGVYAANVVESDIEISTTRSTMDADKETDFSVAKRLSSYDYLGMSVDVGKFGFPYESREKTARNGNVTIVSGASRAPFGNRPDSEKGEEATAQGRVYFIPYEGAVDRRFLKVYDRYLEGEKFGSHFGYSVLAIDIDNDGSDDLVVGAPFHFESTEANEYTGGAIFVYFSTGNGPKNKHYYKAAELFKKKIKIHGQAQSDFGYSLTSLGDIDRDTYNDFAVGAPSYGGGRGAVFIFLGNVYEKFDKDAEPAQVIMASELANGLNSFGYSLSGGSDLDTNLYPDLLVGAALSDTAVLFRARPIIKLRAELVGITKIRRGEKGACDTAHWADTCVPLETELSILDDFGNSNSMQESLDLLRNTTLKCKLTVLVHSEASKTRAVFKEGGIVEEWDCGSSIRNTAGKERKNAVLYLKDNVQDWLHPLLVEFSVSVNAEPKPVVRGSDLPPLVPIVDSRKASQKFELPFDKRCGDDDTCETDLVITCSLAAHHVELRDGVYYLDSAKQIGLTEKDIKINITYKIENRAENAYQSEVFIYFEHGQLERPHLTVLGNRIVNLDPPNEETPELAQIKTGNPMQQGSEVSFTLSFDPVEGKTKGMSAPLVFRAVINSTSEEQDTSNNECELKVKVIKQAEVQIQGISKPDLVYYGGKVRGASDMKYEEDIGDMVYHEYIIENSGPWGVSDITVNIDFPYEVQSPFTRGRWALYPLELPVVEFHDPKDAQYHRKRCEVELNNEIINYFGLFLDPDSMEISNEDELIRIKRKIREYESSASKKRTYSEERTALHRINPVEEIGKDGGKEKVVTISCESGSAKCMKIKCKLEYLYPVISTTIKIRSRIWNSTFVEDYPDVTYARIVSNASLQIPADQGVQDNTTNNYARAITLAFPDLPKITRKQAIPLWVLILAIVIGLFLLFLIIVICWKCGFFKRNRKGRDQPNLYRAELHQHEDWND